MKSFEEANKAEHPAETQWHYAPLIEAGFTCTTPMQTGFVRKYKYINKETLVVISASTGANADYWVNETTGEHGYWDMLKNHLTSGIK